MTALRVLGGGATHGIVDATREDFERATGLSIDGEFGPVNGLRDRVRAGEAVDLVILSRALMDALAGDGLVVASSLRDVGSVATGIAVRTGAPRPDVSTAPLLADLFRRADAILVPDTSRSTAGAHVARVLESLGLSEEVRSKLEEHPGGQAAMAALARSHAPNAVGCTQATEILGTPGIDYVAALPPPYDLATTYTAGIAARSALPQAAATLAEMLSSPKLEETR